MTGGARGEPCVDAEHDMNAHGASTAAGEVEAAVMYDPGRMIEGEEASQRPGLNAWSLVDAPCKARRAASADFCNRAAFVGLYV